MNGLAVGDLMIPDTEIEESFETSGGPGGQHANRTRSAVRLRFAISDSSLPADIKAKLVERLGPVVEASSSESRSQFRNRAIARQRLAERIGDALKERAPRKPTKPSRASKKRRLEKKRARGKLKRQRRRPDID